MKTTEICVKAVIKYDNKFLILTRSQSDMLKKNYDIEKDWLYEGVYDIPWWWIEFWEAPDDALKRELFEEIWLKLDFEFKVLKTWSILEDNYHLVWLTYFIELSQNFDIKLSHEHSDYFWLTKEDILENKGYPEWLKEEINLVK